MEASVWSAAHRPSRTFAIGLVFIAAIYLAQGLYLARVLIPSHDQTSALFVGYLVDSGRISLYQDQMVGHRPPLPAYIFGATQVIMGRNLLAARFLSVGFGVLLVALVGMLGWRLAGELCGLFSAAFVTAQGAVVGYYSMGDYHSLVALVMIAGLAAWLWSDAPVNNGAGAAMLGSLFFVRVHVWPLLPVVLVLGLRRARSWAERLLVAGVMVIPPMIFFLWDIHHLKLLASMPLVGRLVGPLGYVPFALLDGRPYQDIHTQMMTLLHLTRRYEFLVLTAAALTLLVAWRVWRDGPAPYLTNPRINLLGVLFLYNLTCLFLFFRINFKWIGIYVTSLVPLLAVVLGYFVTSLADDLRASRRPRVFLGVALVVLLVLPIYYDRNPLMPIGPARAADPMREAREAGRHLASLVPLDAKVFLFGQVDVFYLSGLFAAYPQQVTNYDTLAVNDRDNQVTLRSGYYGMPQVECWLGSDADYAVISPEALTEFAEALHHHPEANRPKVARMRELLDRGFVKIGTVDDYPYYSYEVYRRVSRSEFGSACGAGPAHPS